MPSLVSDLRTSAINFWKAKVAFQLLLPSVSDADLSQIAQALCVESGGVAGEAPRLKADGTRAKKPGPKPKKNGKVRPRRKTEVSVEDQITKELQKFCVDPNTSGQCLDHLLRLGFTIPGSNYAAPRTRRVQMVRYVREFLDARSATFENVSSKGPGLYRTISS